MEKVVFITGASRGIGLATVKKFASNGWRRQKRRADESPWNGQKSHDEHLWNPEKSAEGKISGSWDVKCTKNLEAT